MIDASAGGPNPRFATASSSSTSPVGAREAPTVGTFGPVAPGRLLLSSLNRSDAGDDAGWRRNRGTDVEDPGSGAEPVLGFTGLEMMVVRLEDERVGSPPLAVRHWRSVSVTSESETCPTGIAVMRKRGSRRSRRRGSFAAEIVFTAPRRAHCLSTTAVEILAEGRSGDRVAGGTWRGRLDRPERPRRMPGSIGVGGSSGSGGDDDDSGYRESPAVVRFPYAPYYPRNEIDIVTVDGSSDRSRSLLVLTAWRFYDTRPGLELPGRPRRRATGVNSNRVVVRCMAAIGGLLR
ncbi:hypothetical protein MAPG_12081 [Magnaporthiopsis poae ATCC 64411]|uniref:Uncharacterized protein n=1 Tax=Magnaporthiopsis poae (strain ATCC 64411 / 73-15) TaxID=644358 RepID=A0A0C4EGT1_MAGP6|nr:hypothetical protein MAPG_12081 [Magnaporthiopsis poae ATCC 64411]